MKTIIITIVATSVLTAFLVVGGMAIFIPKIIAMPDMSKMEMPEMPEMPDMSKMEIPEFEMPDMEAIMAKHMGGISAKITASMPDVGEKTAEMKKVSKDMEDAVEDMEYWAGKMEDSGDEMEETRDDMALLFNPENSAGLFALMGYIDSDNPAGVCAALCTP